MDDRTTDLPRIAPIPVQPAAFRPHGLMGLASPLRAIAATVALVSLLADWANRSDLTAPDDQSVAAFVMGKHPIYDMNISADGRRILTRALHRPVSVLGRCTAESGAYLEEFLGDYTASALSDDGGLVALGAADGTLQIAKVDGSAVIACVEETRISNDTEAVHTLAFSGDGNLLASAGLGKATTIRLWDTRSGQLRHKMPCPCGGVARLAFSPDGTQLAAALTGGQIAIWFLRGQQALFCYAGHRDYVRDIGFLPDGSALLSCSLDGTVRRWEISSAFVPENEILYESRDGLLALAIAPDGKMIAFSDYRNRIRLVSLQSRRVMRTLKAHHQPVIALEFTDRGSQLLAAGHDGLISVWSTASFTLLETLTGSLD